jgi:hypothetical protein
MKIKADAQATQMIQQLADIAIRQGGLASVQGIMQFLTCVELLEETPPVSNPKNL